MKSRLTLIAGALAVIVAIGAVVGFIRRRVERLDATGLASANGSIGSSNGSVGSSPSGASSRGDEADVDGDRT